MAYVYNNKVVTVTNDGRGIFYPHSGSASWNYGSLYVNVSTNKQFTNYGDYNSANDPQYSTAAKFAAVTGWTQLQQSWNAPGANTASRLAALGQFAGTNANNIFQLAAIMGGPDDEGIAAAGDALSAADKGALIKELIGLGTNFKPEEVIGITRMEFNGQVAWLAEGSTKAGLLHILAEHAEQFAGKGISQDKIPGLLIDTLGSQIPDKVIPDTVKGGYELVFPTIGEVTHNWSIVVGDNGFIVSAYLTD